MDFFRKLYDQFVAIVGPGTCTDADIKKYLQWGNGNLETSLNYYFEGQLKAAKKSTTNAKNNRSNNNNKKGQNDNKHQNPLPSESTFHSADINGTTEEGEQPQVTDAFSVLHQGSLKQRELDKLIMSLRVDAKQTDIGKERRQGSGNSVIEKTNTFKQKMDNLSKEMDGQNLSQSMSSSSQNLKKQDNYQSPGDVDDNMIERTEIQQQQQLYSEIQSQSFFEQAQSVKQSSLIEDQSVEKDINKQQSKNNLDNDRSSEEKYDDSSEIKRLFSQKQGFEEMEEQLKQVIQKGEENQPLQFPCFLGNFELQGHSLTTQVCRITKGEEVILKLEKNTSSTGNNQNKKKNSQNNGNNNGKSVMQFIRIVWNEREVGRLNPEYEEILYPLIERGYIYVQAQFAYAPHLLQAFSPISLLVTVSLIRGCLTKPITKIVEENADTKESYILSICAQTKIPFARLFEALGLKKVLGTLVNIADKSKTRQVVQMGSKPGQQGSIMQQIEKQQEGIESVNGQTSNSLGQKQQQQQQQNKIDFNDPFAKMPKQKTLMSYKLEAKDKNSITQDDQSSRQQINKDQLSSSDNQSLQLTQSNEFDLEEVFEEAGAIKELKLSSPPNSFKSNLHPYQKQALTWMLSREGKQTDINELITKDTRTLHPLWEQYALPGKSNTKQHYLYFNPCSGQLSVTFPRAQENCRGGILADEMGLGKTVMMLSLIHSNKRKNHMFFENQLNNDQAMNYIENQGPFKDDQRNSSGGKSASKPQLKNTSIIQMMRKDARTLVIVPVTLLAQWQDEIAVHSMPNSLTYHAYYGSSRGEVENLGQFDIVFTTYGTISSEFASNSQNKPLYKYNWHRIVLDEAHYIKGRVIQCAKAVYALSGDNRWCMTGTPLQNKLDELFPLLHFIQLEPWSDYLWWNNHINKPHEKGEKQVFDVLKTILKPVLLRRTKKSKDSQGKPIVLLPEKYTRIQSVVFTEQERQFYDQVYQSSKEQFEGFLANGILLSNYMKVFELLLRLRQICDHIFMMTTRGDVQSKEGLESKLRAFVGRRNKAIIDEIQQEERKRDLERGAMEILDGWKADNNNNNINNKDNQSKHSHFEVILDENDQEQRVEIPDVNTFDISETYLQKVLQDIEKNSFTTCNICLDDMEDAVITACLHVSCRLCAVKSIEANGMCPICRKFISREDIMTVPRDNRFTFDAESNYVRSSKIAALMEYIEGLRNTDDKCLVFTQFLGVMDLLEIDFKRSNVKYIRLDGSLSQKQRAEIINQFNDDDSIKVFMISLKAGGVGLNLVRANHVLMVDPWWNPAVEEQAIERCHRIGQKKDVYVTRFICDNSIESRMILLHNEKRDLFENTISGGKKDKKEQNIENFKYLMQDYDKN